MQFHEGDKVAKAKGYHYAGTIVSVYQKTTGETRYDVEFIQLGMVHIYSAEQLIPITQEQFNDCADAMRVFTTTLNRARNEYQTRQQELPFGGKPDTH